jgi:hypothetical protein
MVLAFEAANAGLDLGESTIVHAATVGQTMAGTILFAPRWRLETIYASPVCSQGRLPVRKSLIDPLPENTDMIATPQPVVVIDHAAILIIGALVERVGVIVVLILEIRRRFGLLPLRDRVLRGLGLLNLRLRRRFRLPEEGQSLIEIRVGAFHPGLRSLKINLQTVMAHMRDRHQRPFANRYRATLTA